MVNVTEKRISVFERTRHSGRAGRRVVGVGLLVAMLAGVVLQLLAELRGVDAVGLLLSGVAVSLVMVCLLLMALSVAGRLAGGHTTSGAAVLTRRGEPLARLGAWLIVVALFSCWLMVVTALGSAVWLVPVSWLPPGELLLMSFLLAWIGSVLLGVAHRRSQPSTPAG